ncbi:MAG: trigger factor [Chloroflexi bacterium]|nr:trigger factor [Chloroflexota bacterium]
MQIVDKKFEDHSNIFTVELDEAEVEEYLQRAYKKIVKKMTIKGFRKGKAPRPIVEQTVGGRAAMLLEVEEDMRQLKKMEWSDQPEFAGVSELLVILTALEPKVQLEVVSPQAPEINLGDYQSICVPEIKSEFSEAKVDEAVEDLLRDKADYAPSQRTTVQEYDLVLFDVLGKSGEEILLDQKDAQYVVRIGSPYPMRGFAHALVGSVINQNKSFTLDVPDDFPKEAFRGQKAEFTVTIKEIKEQLLPELNDDFAASFSEEFKTLEELKERIRLNLSRNYSQNAKKAWEAAIFEAALAKADIKFPSSLVGEEVGNMLNEDMMRLRSNSRSAADFTKQLESINRDEMMTKYTPIAREAVRKSLYMQKLMDTENITVSDEELEQEIAKALEMMTEGQEKENYKKALENQEYKMQLKHVLLTEKATVRLREIALGNSAGKKAAKTSRAAVAKEKPITEITAKKTVTEVEKSDNERKATAKPRAKKTDAK